MEERATEATEAMVAVGTGGQQIPMLQYITLLQQYTIPLQCSIMCLQQHITPLLQLSTMPQLPAMDHMAPIAMDTALPAMGTVGTALPSICTALPAMGTVSTALPAMDTALPAISTLSTALPAMG